MVIWLLHKVVPRLRMQQSKGGQRIERSARRASKTMRGIYGRPTTATTEKHIAHAHRVVMDERRLTVNKNAIYCWHLP